MHFYKDDCSESWSLLKSILVGLVAFIILIFGYNTEIVEVGVQPYHTVLYRNVLRNNWYVDHGPRTAVVVDSCIEKMIDDIPNRYYVVRQYNGFLYFKKDEIIKVIQ